MQNKINKLSYNRIKYFIEHEIGFYKGNSTYIKGLKEEIKEVEDEIKNNNSVYLEDELGDVFWDYICLLHSLKNEGKIESIENVFNRCYKKFSGRIGQNGKGLGEWEEIKKIQKKELKIEHNKMYRNDK